MKLNAVGSSSVAWTTYQGPYNQRKLTFHSLAAIFHQYFLTWGLGIVSSPLIHICWNFKWTTLWHIPQIPWKFKGHDANLTRRYCFPACLSSRWLLESSHSPLPRCFLSLCDIVTSSKAEQYRSSHLHSLNMGIQNYSFYIPTTTSGKNKWPVNGTDKAMAIFPVPM